MGTTPVTQGTTVVPLATVIIQGIMAAIIGEDSKLVHHLHLQHITVHDITNQIEL